MNTKSLNASKNKDVIVKNYSNKKKTFRIHICYRRRTKFRSCELIKRLRRTLSPIKTFTRPRSRTRSSRAPKQNPFRKTKPGTKYQTRRVFIFARAGSFESMRGEQKINMCAFSVSFCLFIFVEMCIESCMFARGV